MTTLTRRFFCSPLQWGLCALALAVLAPMSAQAALYISIIQGLGGMPEYAEEFTRTREKVEAASATMTDKDKVFSFTGEKATRDALLKHFSALTKKLTADDRAAIYLVGHGSFDGETYKFNISGADLTAADFKKVMDELPGRNHFLLNTSSTSGAMLETLVGKGNDAKSAKYIVVSATRNGNERNATHFGGYFAEALTNKAADLNKNNSVSAQEAYDYAATQLDTYFKDDGKLATEHAQLRGDGAAQLNLSRLNALELKSELAVADAGLSALLKRRQELEAQIEDLQLKRSGMSNTDYLTRLQTLVLQSAELSEKIEAAQGAGKSDSSTQPQKATIPIPAPGAGRGF
jgi:hypothetical protein